MARDLPGGKRGRLPGTLRWIFLKGACIIFHNECYKQMPDLWNERSGASAAGQGERKTMKHTTTAVLVAAGNSTRMGFDKLAA